MFLDLLSMDKTYLTIGLIIIIAVVTRWWGASMGARPSGVAVPKAAVASGAGVPVRQAVDVTKLKVLTVEELKTFDGADGESAVYVALRGVVFDVTSHPTGRSFYGAGGAYHIFAGGDATLALARMSLDPSHVNSKQWKDGGLSIIEKETLSSWLSKFEAKYEVVGRLEGFFDEKELVKGKVAAQSAEGGPAPSGDETQ
eukprot:Selendium_serpulae@DN1911_c0_g1_i1.p1